MPKMFDKSLQMLSPKHTIIENIAANMAAEYYEMGRSAGMKSKHKNARSYAKEYFEHYIPNAVEVCLNMLADPSYSDDIKRPIYEAIMERTNDPMLNSILPNPIQAPIMNMKEFFKDKIAPVIVNTTRAPELDLEKDKLDEKVKAS